MISKTGAWVNLVQGKVTSQRLKVKSKKDITQKSKGCIKIFIQAWACVICEARKSLLVIS